MHEHGSTLAALMLLFGATTATAETAHPPTPAGAYETMSPGNQNVARALHEAQSLTPLPQNGGGSRKPLSLEQIASMKQHSTGWEQVVREMQKKGLLLKDKTLAQIVSRYNQTARPMATSATRATPKTNGDRGARGWHPDEAIAAPAIVGATTLQDTGRDPAPVK
jgi:hypothetical protein